jgi:hypothetical protein
MRDGLLKHKMRADVNDEIRWEGRTACQENVCALSGKWNGELAHQKTGSAHEKSGSNHINRNILVKVFALEVSEKRDRLIGLFNCLLICPANPSVILQHMGRQICSP